MSFLSLVFYISHTGPLVADDPCQLLTDQTFCKSECIVNERETERERETDRDKDRDRQTGRQGGRLAGRQTDRQLRIGCLYESIN